MLDVKAGAVLAGEGVEGDNSEVVGVDGMDELEETEAEAVEGYATVGRRVCNC